MKIEYRYSANKRLLASRALALGVKIRLLANHWQQASVCSPTDSLVNKKFRLFFSRLSTVRCYFKDFVLPHLHINFEIYIYIKGITL